VTQRFVKRNIKIIGFGHPYAHCATQFGIRSELRIVQAGLSYLPVTRALFLADLSEFAIIHQDMSDIHAVLHR
jgi:hypothetical protein